MIMLKRLLPCSSSLIIIIIIFNSNKFTVMQKLVLFTIINCDDNNMAKYKNCIRRSTMDDASHKKILLSFLIVSVTLNILLSFIIFQPFTSLFTEHTFSILYFRYMGFCRIVPVYSYFFHSFIHSFFAHAKLCIHYCVQCKNYNFLFLWFRIVLNLTSECETINFN